MNALSHVGFDGFAQAFAATVIHFAWQATAIGLVAAVLLAGMRRAAPQARYAVSCLAMTAMVLAFLGTLLSIFAPGHSPSHLVPEARWLEPVSMSGAISGSTAHASEAGYPEPGSDQRLALELIALTWLAGTVLFSIRAARSWRSACRLGHAATMPLHPAWRTTVDALALEAGLSRPLRALQSAIAETPMVIGWLRPILLIPVSAFTALPPDQLRAILAHEFAHVRRLDHVINGLQIIVATVLFFHPAVWWISRRIRTEREYCCDDAAVQLTGNRLVYARALSQLEALRVERGTFAHPFALGANGGSLLNRIERTVARDAGHTSSRVRVAIAASVLGVVALGAVATTFIAADSANAEAPADAGLAAYSAKLDALVASGKLLPEDAAAKLAAGVPTKKVQKSDPATDIAAALKAGKITPEEAAAKLAAVKTGNKVAPAHNGDVETAIWDALAAGKITSAEAQAKMAAVRAATAK